MGVPWETIIKQYRENLSDRPFNSLEEYGNDFISYLNNNTLLFPSEVQDESAIDHVIEYLVGIRKSIDNTVEGITHQGLKVKINKVKQIVRTHISQWYEALKEETQFPSLPSTFEKDILAKYETVINELIEAVFQTLPINQLLGKRLKAMCVWLLTRDMVRFKNRPEYSGIVIAGFGETDIYPSIINYRVQSVVLNHLKYIVQPDGTDKIGPNETALVIAFAQKEMVTSFMEGIDPDFKTLVNDSLRKILAVYPDEIIKQIPTLPTKQMNEIMKALKKVADDLVDLFEKEIEAHSSTKHVNPIIKATSVLPKEELALMAEALVNLTSFKRRVTLEAETVGGPIDVAVISKGDGFIWIKRKHYFDADKNPQFFRNKHR